jgi:hypothetical protein
LDGHFAVPAKGYVLARAFKHIQEHDYDEVFELSPELVSELFALVVLSPLFCTDLRAFVDEELSLADACGEWKAEVLTTLTEELAKELVRQKLSKSTWCKLLSPLRALLRVHGKLSPEDEVPEGEEPLAAHPVWTAVARCLKFLAVGRRRVRRRAHINVSELEALLEAEERKAQKNPNARILIADSQVTLGSLVKGRASSAAFNARLRRALPVVLGYNVYTASQYIPSAENVADDPTRDRACRSPPEPTPLEWLTAAMEGSFDALDAMLATV